MSNGQSKSRKVEVFRAGTFRAMNGQDYSFSEADVQSMAAGYDPDKAPAPVVVGHPKHDDPAFGWARGFEVNDAGVLVAEIDQLAPEFVSAVEEGRYRKISMKFFPPDAPNNPVPGQYYPRHIGFLGGAAPAVSGLAPVQFSGEDDELIEVAFSSLSEATESTASIFRSVREFFIEKFGLDAANQAVPEYYIRWIEDAGKEPDPAPGFSAPPPPKSSKEKPMSGENDLAARAADLEKRERALANKENLAFADDLIKSGKLLPAQKSRVVALLDDLSVGDAQIIAFSDDGTEKSVAGAQLLKEILSAAGTSIALGSTDLGDDPTSTRAVAFAADGIDVDSDALELHRRALGYQTKNPGTDYLSAVRAVQEG